jgi:hypothetical protein
MLCLVNEFCITRFTSDCYTIRKHLTSDQRVGGSNPSRCTTLKHVSDPSTMSNREFKDELLIRTITS